MATRVGDTTLVQILARHDPEALATVSPDGRTLIPDPTPWRALFKKYTTREIPPDVQDAKEYFLDRVVLSSEGMFNQFSTFLKAVLNQEAQTAVDGIVEPWRFYWHCAFPFDPHYRVTFTAQNVKEVTPETNRNGRIGIYLDKIGEEDSKITEWWDHEDDFTEKKKNHKAHLFLTLPRDFQHLSEVRHGPGLQVPVSAPAVLRERFSKKFDDEYLFYLLKIF